MASVTLGTAQLVACDLVLVQGCTACFEFEWTRDGEPVDLDGASALCQLRTSSNGRLVVDLSAYVDFADGGLISLSIDPAATADVVPGWYVWDLIVTEPDGAVSRVAAGNAQVVDPVSEAE